MARIGHGETGGTRSDEEIGQFSTRAVQSVPQSESSFDYMFASLQGNPANLLPEGEATIAHLQALGATMADAAIVARVDPLDGPIPAAYTYFGQFVDHDITLDLNSGTMHQLIDPSLKPIGPAGLRNGRSAALDLDSVYGGMTPDADGTLRLGRNSESSVPDHPISDFNDLHRKPRGTDPATDREAIIGDPRNDENLIIAQLHVAFVKVHNVIARAKGFSAARAEVRDLYHRIIVHDFLPKIIDPTILNAILTQGPTFFRPGANPKMPLEFSAAGFRFGHSMIRSTYNYNSIFPNADLGLLFTFTALSGNIGQGVVGNGFDQVPKNWIINWANFLPRTGSVHQRARRIDTMLTDFTFRLQTVDGKVEQGLAAHLAKRNLLRGYRLSLPTGQAVAEVIGADVLRGEALLDAVPEVQRDALTPFSELTPLWYYILAEAGDPAGPEGAHLGPVGSTIVAETLIGLLSAMPDAKAPNEMEPFSLGELLDLAGP